MTWSQCHQAPLGVCQARCCYRIADCFLYAVSGSATCCVMAAHVQQITLLFHHGPFQPASWAPLGGLYSCPAPQCVQPGSQETPGPAVTNYDCHQNTSFLACIFSKQADRQQSKTLIACLPWYACSASTDIAHKKDTYRFMQVINVDWQRTPQHCDYAGRSSDLIMLSQAVPQQYWLLPLGAFGTNTSRCMPT